MCDLKKSKLRDYLTKNVLQAELPVGSITHIIDSGALLYSVKWIPNTTYRDIVKQYQNYMLSTFGLCTVIFDGYNNGPSTKDIKHVRGSRTSQTVTVDLNKRVTVAQEKFLKNGRNKNMLISFLCDNLREHEFTIREARAHADTLIVTEPVKEAKKKIPWSSFMLMMQMFFVYVCITAKMFWKKFPFKLLKRLKTITVKSGVSEMLMKKWVIEY